MNVGQAFLQNTKHGQFKVGRESAEVIRNIERNLQATTFRQPLHIPLNRLRQTTFVQQGRAVSKRLCESLGSAAGPNSGCSRA